MVSGYYSRFSDIKTKRFISRKIDKPVLLPPHLMFYLTSRIYYTNNLTSCLLVLSKGIFPSKIMNASDSAHRVTFLPIKNLHNNLMVIKLQTFSGWIFYNELSAIIKSDEDEAINFFYAHSTIAFVISVINQTG